MDVVFFAMRFRKLFLVPTFRRRPIELRDELLRAEVLVRIAVTGDAPRHRQLFGLVDNFHLVDPAVAGLAADTGIHVCGVIEVDELGQVVDPFPRHAAPSLPTLVNRLQLGTGRVHRAESRRLAVFSGGRVAINARRRRWNRSVSGIENGVVAVPTIHFQLTGVQRMAERHRLRRHVANVQRFRISDQTTHCGSVNATTNGG